MHKKLLIFLSIKKYYTITALLIVILILGLFLRHHNYRIYPRHGATFDEFAWTWQGINLIQKGTPMSWSPQPQYKDVKEIRYQGAAFLLVQPYLEHPPLFGLVAGGVALLNDAKDMYDVTLAKIRPLALLLGVLSIFMLFLFVNEIYGVMVALTASLLYAVVPTVVIGSRIVQNENFLIHFWLLALYLIIKYIKSGKKRFRNTAAIIAGLLSLAKVPWLVVGLSLSLILSYKGKWRDSFIIGTITMLIFSSFILYGFYFDKDLFINLLRLQTARYDISFVGFFSIFTKPLLVDRFYLDGWILFGWLSIFLLSQDFKKHFWILIPFISYLIVYVFAIPDEPMHGWYRYPFYPFLLTALALVIKNEFKKISIVTLFFLFIVGFSLLNNAWLPILGFSYYVYRIFIILSVFPLLLIIWFNKQYSRVLLSFWLFVFICLSIFSVISFSDI